jgi:biotin transporter BioY
VLLVNYNVDNHLNVLMDKLFALIKHVWLIKKIVLQLKFVPMDMQDVMKILANLIVKTLEIPKLLL